MRSIYLDYNATTPLAPRAQDAMIPYLADRFADPHGEHAQGRAIGQAIEDARLGLAQAIGASPGEVCWTSGATESCNLALHGVLAHPTRSGESPHVVVSAVDHAAVLGPARYLAGLGAELTVVPCDAAGLVDPGEVVEALRSETRLVSVVHANDEVGSIQPIAEIAEACREEGVLVHSDAAQTLGKIPLSVKRLGVDLMSFSAHKCYGPKGAGALYVRRGVPLDPLLHGEAREGGLRAGMPNVAGVIGFAAAAEMATESLERSAPRLAALRDTLCERLLAGVGEGQVYGPRDEQRLPGTLCINLPGVTASDLLNAVPEISASPCAYGAGVAGEGVTLCGTLRAMGASPESACGALRLTIGWYTDEEEVEMAADALLEAWRQMH